MIDGNNQPFNSDSYYKAYEEFVVEFRKRDSSYNEPRFDLPADKTQWNFNTLHVVYGL